MIEAVIFDMDGVLADTEYYYENRRKNFLLENGIPIPEGNFIGSNEKAIWEAIVPNDPVRRQEMLMAYREYRKARPTPYGKLTDPQAEPLMNALRSRGLKVAVASSSAAPDISLGGLTLSGGDRRMHRDQIARRQRLLATLDDDAGEELVQRLGLRAVRIDSSLAGEDATQHPARAVHTNDARVHGR